MNMWVISSLRLFYPSLVQLEITFIWSSTFGVIWSDVFESDTDSQEKEEEINT